MDRASRSGPRENRRARSGDDLHDDLHDDTTTVTVHPPSPLEELAIYCVGQKSSANKSQ